MAGRRLDVLTKSQNITTEEVNIEPILQALTA